MPSDREDPPKPDPLAVAIEAVKAAWNHEQDSDPWATAADIVRAYGRAYARAEVRAALTKLAEEYREKQRKAGEACSAAQQRDHQSTATIWDLHGRAAAFREAAEMADRAAGKERA